MGEQNDDAYSSNPAHQHGPLNMGYGVVQFVLLLGSRREGHHGNDGFAHRHLVIALPGHWNPTADRYCIVLLRAQRVRIVLPYVDFRPGRAIGATQRCPPRMHVSYCFVKSDPVVCCFGVCWFSARPSPRRYTTMSAKPPFPRQQNKRAFRHRPLFFFDRNKRDNAILNGASTVSPAHVSPSRGACPKCSVRGGACQEVQASETDPPRTAGGGSHAQSRRATC